MGRRVGGAKRDMDLYQHADFPSSVRDSEPSSLALKGNPAGNWTLILLVLVSGQIGRIWMTCAFELEYHWIGWGLTLRVWESRRISSLTPRLMSEQESHTVVNICRSPANSLRSTSIQHWTRLKLQGKLACLSSADHSVSHSLLKNTALSEDIVIFTVKSRLQVLPTRLNLSIWFPTTQVPHCLHHTTEQITETLPHILNGCHAYRGMHRARHDRIVDLIVKDISNHVSPLVRVYKHSCVKHLCFSISVIILTCFLICLWIHLMWLWLMRSVCSGDSMHLWF